MAGYGPLNKKGCAVRQKSLKRYKLTKITHFITSIGLKLDEIIQEIGLAFGAFFPIFVRLIFG